MRKITANLIHPVSSAPIKDAYLLIDDEGRIVDLVNYERNQKEPAGLEYYSGILVPGFVNAHAHLELSHLKGKIEQNQGLNNFIKNVQNNRESPKETIENKMQLALRYMWSRGISGLGDIVNSTVGLHEKRQTPILTHNFVELFNETNKSVSEIIQKGVAIVEEYSNKHQTASLAPHSMYGTQMDLLNKINSANKKHKNTSLHFLESRWESQLEKQTILDYLEKFRLYERILLVHNLYLSKELWEAIKKDNKLYDKIHWVICPNSNRYIKSQLPPLSDFYKWGMRLCLGTDSLASNLQLSILDEMKTLSTEFSDLPFEAILQMATLNGARALGMQEILGSFEVGKIPGVLLISGYDFKKTRLTAESEVTRLV